MMDEDEDLPQKPDDEDEETLEALMSTAVKKLTRTLKRLVTWR